MFVTPLLGWDFQVPHPTFLEESELVYLHPPKTNMTIEKQPFEDLKMYLLSNTLIAYCHASFQGCSHCNTSKNEPAKLWPSWWVNIFLLQSETFMKQTAMTI